MSDAITAKDLKEILADQARQNAEMLRSVIEEVKKPNAMEQRELDATLRKIAETQESREEMSAMQLKKIEDERFTKRTCTHKHPARDNYASHCVYITTGGYFLCQKNQCKIYPGVAPKGYKGTDIFSDTLYNELFQTLAQD